MADHATAIVVENLVKVYGATRAVDGLSFSVRTGEVFGFLGPNGAGKTTTIEILEGYRRADEGHILVLGLDPRTQGNQLKPRIGAMLQEGGLYPGITAGEALSLFATYYPSARRRDELLDAVGLADVANVPYRRLSGGQKQRLSLALALVGRPELVFLDEPTAGLDPRGRRATWDLVSELRRQGVTIVLSTHNLEEAERLADRVAIIHHGRLLALGAPDELKQGGTSMVRMRADQEIDPIELRALPTATNVQVDGAGTYVVETADVAAFLVEVASWCQSHDIRLRELRVGQGSLEDVFLRLTGQEFEP